MHTPDQRLNRQTEIFWGEIAPGDHILQVYENDDCFLEALTQFVAGGIKNDEGVIVIATHPHLTALEDHLASWGMNADQLIADERYLAVNASEMLSRFMVNDWPDETLFRRTVSEVISRALDRNKRIRAFGEMVAVLWSQGYAGATVQLEHLWNRFSLEFPFPLFCAYPKAGFTENMNISLQHICAAHNKMVRDANTHFTSPHSSSMPIITHTPDHD